VAMTHNEAHDYLLWKAYQAQELLKRPEVKALWERGKPQNREEALLLQEIREGLEAREEVLLENMRLVYDVARRYQNHARGVGIPFEDLVQQGTLGFLEALDRFNPGTGYRLSTWVYHHVRWRIQQLLAQRRRLHASLDGELPDKEILYGDTFAAEGPTPEELAEEKAFREWWDRNAPGLVELVEGGESPGRAAKRLGTSLERLRKTLGEEARSWV
jgi:RNA polymerase sigma factor (sigma-70 family)